MPAQTAPAVQASSNVPTPPPMQTAAPVSGKPSEGMFLFFGSWNKFVDYAATIKKLKEEIEKLGKKLSVAEDQAKQGSSHAQKKDEEISSLKAKLSEEEERTKKALEEIEKQKERTSQLKAALDKEKSDAELLRGDIDKHLREHVCYFL